MRRHYIQDLLRSPTDFPTLEDIENGIVAKDDDRVYKILNQLARERHCLLRGPVGRGKRTLSRFVAYLAWKDGQTVQQIDLAEAGSDTPEQVAEVIRYFDDANSRPLYIVENIHACEADESLRQVLAAAIASSHSQFLYTECAVDTKTVFEHFELALRGRSDWQDLTVELPPSLDMIRAIVSLHATRDERRMPADAEIESLADKCGGDLRILRAYLDAWESGSISEIDEAAMLTTAYRLRLAPLAENAQIALVKASCVAQFDSAVFSPAFGDALEQLADQRLIGKTFIGFDRYYRLPHASEARINVRAWCHVNGQDSDTLTRDELANYLRHAPATTSQLLRDATVAERRKHEAQATMSRNQWLSNLSNLRKRPELLQALLSRSDAWGAFLDAFRATVKDAPIGYIQAAVELVSDLPSRVTELLLAVREVGTVSLAQKIAEEDQPKAAWMLAAYRKLDKSFAKDVSSRISSDMWEQIWIRTSLPKLIRFFLGRYGKDPSLHEHTEQARRVLMNLAQSEEFPVRLGRLSYENVGKLLLTANRLGEDCSQLVGAAVASNLEIRDLREPEKLTLILKELWQSGNRPMFIKLVDRVVQDLPLNRFVEEPSGRGVAFLSRNLTQAIRDPTLALYRDASFEQRVLNAWRLFISAALETKVSSWHPISFSTFLFSALLLDEDAAKEWLNRVPLDAATCILQRELSPQEAFRFLWNIAQIDRDYAERIVTSAEPVFRTILGRAAQSADAAAEALPLLGLLGWLKCFVREVSLPQVDFAVSYLCERMDASQIVFALWYYGQVSKELAQVLWNEVSMRVEEVKGIHASEFLCEHPVDRIQRLLRVAIATYTEEPGDG